MKNCQNYGFILRYPKDKTDITQYIYEPWHYRYVGEEAAKAIMEKGITLEEYLAQIPKISRKSFYFASRDRNSFLSIAEKQSLRLTHKMGFATMREVG